MLSVVLVFILTTILIFLATLHFRRIHVQNNQLKNFSYIPGLPLIGNLFITWGHSNEKYLDLLLNLFSSVKTPAYAWVGPQLVFGLDDPEDFQTVLSSDICLKKPFVYDSLRFSRGLVTCLPSIWKEHRRALNPTFSQKMVTIFIPKFNGAFKIMADQMEEFVGKDIDIHKMMFKAAGDVLVNASLGLKWSIQSEHGNKLHSATHHFMSCVQFRMMRFWLKYEFLYHFTTPCKVQNQCEDTIQKFVNGVHEAKVVELHEKKANGIDELAETSEANNMNLLQKIIHLNNQNKFSMIDVQDEMCTFFIASTDTSSMALKTITLMLAIHQDYQDHVADELREIFENRDDPVTMDDLSKMTYLELAIKESLRLFPIGPMLGRENTEDLKCRGSVIPKGTFFLLNVLKIHRDPKYWGENSMEFYPERFLPENFANVHPFAYVPFSAGPRNCIGYRYAWASMKMAMAYILRRYRLTSKLKMEDIRIEAALVIKFLNENPVQLERREWKKT